MRAVPVTPRQVMFTVCGQCPSLHAEGLIQISLYLRLQLIGSVLNPFRLSRTNLPICTEPKIFLIIIGAYLYFFCFVYSVVDKSNIKNASGNFHVGFVADTVTQGG